MVAEIWASVISSFVDQLVALRGRVFESHWCHLETFGNFFYPTLPMYFRRDTKSRWSFLFGVYARGSKRCHILHILSDQKCLHNGDQKVCKRKYTYMVDQFK